MKNYKIRLPSTGIDQLLRYCVALMALVVSPLALTQNFNVLLENSGEVKEEAYDYLRKATFGTTHSLSRA